MPLTGDVAIKITPLRVSCFNKIEFPHSWPVLDIFLTLNCQPWGVVPFKMNQRLKSVSFRESVDQACAMFVRAANEIVGHADV